MKETIPEDGNPIQEKDTFKLFPKLPIELRLKIWKTAAEEPRVVNVELKNGHEEFSDWEFGSGGSKDDKNHLVCSTFTPALLHTCHESRVEGLKQYDLLGGRNESDDAIFLNFERDTIYFQDRSGMCGCESIYGKSTLNSLRNALNMEPRKKIQRLIICQYAWFLHHGREKSCVRLLAKEFRNITSLTFSLHDGSLFSKTGLDEVVSAGWRGQIITCEQSGKWEYTYDPSSEEKIEDFKAMLKEFKEDKKQMNTAWTQPVLGFVKLAKRSKPYEVWDTGEELEDDIEHEYHKRRNMVRGTF